MIVATREAVITLERAQPGLDYCTPNSLASHSRLFARLFSTRSNLDGNPQFCFATSQKRSCCNFTTASGVSSENSHTLLSTNFPCEAITGQESTSKKKNKKKTQPLRIARKKQPISHPPPLNGRTRMVSLHPLFE